MTDETGVERLAAWVRLAVRPSAVRRGALCALVVESVLTIINHGDALLAGDWSGARVTGIVLTALVPYCVTTFASVSATREARRAASRPSVAGP